MSAETSQLIKAICDLCFILGVWALIIYAIKMTARLVSAVEAIRDLWAAAPDEGDGDGNAPTVAEADAKAD